MVKDIAESIIKILKVLGPSFTYTDIMMMPVDELYILINAKLDFEKSSISKAESATSSDELLSQISQSGYFNPFQ